MSPRERGQSGARNLLTEPRSAGNEETCNTLDTKFPSEDHAAVSPAAAEKVLASVAERENGNAPPFREVRSVVTASAGIWPDPIEVNTVPNHAREAAPTAAVVTAAAVAIPAAVVAASMAAIVTVGAACAGVRSDQVQDGPARGAARLEGTPGFGPPSWTSSVSGKLR